LRAQKSKLFKTAKEMNADWIIQSISKLQACHTAWIYCIA